MYYKNLLIILGYHLTAAGNVLHILRDVGKSPNIDIMSVSGQN